MLTSAKSFQANLDLFARLLTLPRSPLLKPLKQVLRKLLRRLLRRLLKPLKQVLRRLLRRLLRPLKLLRLPKPLRRIIVYQLILLTNVERELLFVRKDTAAVNMVTVESLMTTVRVAAVANQNLVNANKFKKKEYLKNKVTIWHWSCLLSIIKKKLKIIYTIK